MSTPFSDIYIRFSDNFSEADAEKIDIFQKKKFLRSAISLFIANVRTIEVDYDNVEIAEDLSEVELNLMGLFMYDAYLNQDLYKYNKLVNISSEVFKMTGNQERVKTLKDMIHDNNIKINNLLASLLY